MLIEISVCLCVDFTISSVVEQDEIESRHSKTHLRVFAEYYCWRVSAHFLNASSAFLHLFCIVAASCQIVGLLDHFNRINSHRIFSGDTIAPTTPTVFLKADLKKLGGETQLESFHQILKRYCHQVLNL